MKILIFFVFVSFQVSSSYLEKKYSSVDAQVFDYTCGIASLSNILKKYYGINESEMSLLSKMEIKPDYSFKDLSTLALSHDIKTVGVKITLEQLKKINKPIILYIKRFGNGHFVIYGGAVDNYIQIDDPAWGSLSYTYGQFKRYWIDSNGLGKALIFTTPSKQIISPEKETNYILDLDF